MKRARRHSAVGLSGRDSDLDVRQLRAFLAVVEYGTVSGAALALGLAQSTVSEALATLDRALGVPTVLRKRGAQRMPLTAAGVALIPHARRALQAIDAAHLSVASVTRAASARLDVIANESVTTYLLPPVLGALRKTWPRTRFAVSIATCASIRAQVVGGRRDLGLLLEEDTAAARTTRRPGSSLTAQRHELRNALQLVIFAEAKHPLMRAGPRSFVRRDALREFPIFVSDAAGDFYEMLLAYFTADGLKAPRLEAAGTIEGVRRGVADDALALGVLPLYALSEDLRLGRAHALTVRPAPPHMRLVALLSPTRIARHPAISELLERLRQP